MNLLNIQHKDYKVDFNKLKMYFDYLFQIHEFATNNKIYYSIIGHISLILLSRKVYRNPDDIDILIKLDELDKWVDFIKEDWDWFGHVNAIEFIHMFKKDELQKFASININNCSIKEDTADLYKINDKNFTLFSSSQCDNIIDEKLIVQPQFLYHDPTKKRHDGKDFIEINEEKFKIWFYTNALTQHFASYIIFYDKDLNYKEIIQCDFIHDYIKDNVVYAYWCSPEIDLKKFDGCYYRIVVNKQLLSIRFQNKLTKTLMEFYIYKNFFKVRNVPIFFQDRLSVIRHLNVKFQGLLLPVQYPFRALNNKYGRQKDLDDYEVYEYLMKQYPCDYRLF